ncbi:MULTISPECIES: hypothetical protein [Acinetobacter calcoaceticus/baumannii complex]|uniref:phage tail fiber protein n=1 Tax=Acinetobacter calcoaceticus/baumannii complex TaxID=909768 RepID=UPI0024DE3F77|nr:MULTISPECIES: hypothetical protein [Acinetobacter calcoaceticus/baumannii complex]MDR0069365.1 hypothetical protein [Acinetobacter sp. 11520]HAV4225472.1 hypothetical protein [Acinetobacter baumannii]
MTYQTVNLGTAPTGAGGDTFRSTGAKINENFTNNTHAASRYVGTQPGNVMEVGAFGLGKNMIQLSMPNDTDNVLGGGFYYYDVNSSAQCSWKDVGTNFFVLRSNFANNPLGFELGNLPYNNAYYLRCSTPNATQKWNTPVLIRHSGNTTIDSNGFLKAASPIVKLFADKIEPNNEAAEQIISFEKVDVGHYLVKGTSGFAKEGWWIEIPTDTHGNKICAVEYQTLENGDLEIKTFKKKLNDEGDIVPNHEAPIDIPNNLNDEPRWIDIRLNKVKKTIVSKVPRTEKQPRMVQQIKYSMQPTFMTRLTELIDDEGKVVMVDGKPFQKKETYLVTDSSGMATLTKQPVINENGEPVLEWVQAVDSDGNPVFDDVQVKDKDGNPIFDEVIHESE